MPSAFVIEPTHSRFGFTVRHLGFSKVRGHFGAFTGTIAFDPSDLTTLTAEASAETASIDTANEQRDAHLRSADFFDAEANPAVTFVSTRVENVSGSTFTLVGDLTMHGVTREVAFEAEHLGTETDPWGNVRHAFEATASINRTDFGLNWNAVLESGGLLVSEKVEISLELQTIPAPVEETAA